MIKLALIFALTFGVNARLSADDTAAQALLAQAKNEFATRTAFARDEKSVKTSVELLEKALQESTSDAVRYDVLVYTTRVLVWHGLHTDIDNPTTVYETAYKKADEARKLKGFESYAEANYYYSVALGRWALEKGPLTVLGRVKEMKSALDAAINGETLNGDLGEEYDYYGPDRVYSRLYKELPALAGGDKKKSRQHAEAAYTAFPDHTLNALYYAEILEAQKETASACKVLKGLVNTSATVIPDRTADATEDLAAAQKMHDEICVQ